MKESLSILFKKLGITFPIVPFNSGISKQPTDEEILHKAKKIKNTEEKEKLLLDFVEGNPTKYLLSANYLIKLIKSKNPLYAYELAYRIAKYSLTDPIPYCLLAEIAIENKAWEVAKSTAEAAKWLAWDCNNKTKSKINDILKEVSKKISGGISDITYNSPWKEKIVDKLMTLVMLQHSLEKNIFFSYCIHLLEIFPEDLENFERVLEMVSQIDSKEITHSYINFITENKTINNHLKYKLLGIAHHLIFEPDQSSIFLNKCLESNSNDLTAKYFISLNYFVKGELDKFSKSFESLVSMPDTTRPDFENLFKAATPTIQASFFLWSAINNIKINPEIKKTDDEKKISYEIARLLNKLIKTKRDRETSLVIQSLIKLNYHKLLPTLQINLAEAFIRNKDIEKAKEVLEDCTDNEVNRIYSWIYRLENNELASEEKLIAYRKNIDYINLPFPLLQMTNPNYPNRIPDNKNEIMGLLGKIYDETTEIKKELALEYGINQNTCFETACTECCTKTHPWVSYTEYLYLKDWLEKQPEKLKTKVYTESVEIVKKYKGRFKKEPLFLKPNDNDILKEYPPDFYFDCPFLENNLCTAYEAQPFMCRVYGLGSGDLIQFKGCNYYMGQFKTAGGSGNKVKVIDILSFTDFTSLTDKALIDANVTVPLPIWFAQSHEETLWKAKTYLLPKTIFKPIYKVLSKLYIMLLNAKKKRKLSAKECKSSKSKGWSER